MALPVNGRDLWICYESHWPYETLFSLPSTSFALPLHVLSLLKMHVSVLNFIHGNTVTISPISLWSTKAIGLRFEQWAEDVRVLSLSRLQPSLPSWRHGPGAVALPWISLGSCLVPGPKEGKNWAWNTAQCGRGKAFMWLRDTSLGAVIPSPSLHLQMPFRMSGWLTVLKNKGQRRCFPSGKESTKNMQIGS